MAKKSKTSTSTTAAPPANATNAAPEEWVIVPQVSTMPDAVARLTWLERLILADDFLLHPRRFLAQTTHSDHEAKDPQTKPKADHKTIAYAELRQVLDAFLPDSAPSMVNNRRIQRLFLLNKLNELPADELETGVSRLINRLQPFGFGDRPGFNSWGDEVWIARKKQHQEHVGEIIAEIDSEIRRCLLNGERDDRLVVTSDLPHNLLSLHSESDLMWEMERGVYLAAIFFDNLPNKSPLRKLDPERLPRLNRTGGPAVVILGPATPATMRAIPRSFYHLATVETFTRMGWQVWAERYRSYLQHRDTEEEFARFQVHEALCTKPLPVLWSYPEAPPVPKLDGFANRALFCIDVVGHLGKYISKPSANRSLSDLLTARRVLVDAVADQDQHPNIYAAKSWVGRWYTSNHRDDLAEALWALAKTTLQTVEDLEMAYRDHALGEYQRNHILKAEGK